MAESNWLMLTRRQVYDKEFWGSNNVWRCFCIVIMTMQQLLIAANCTYLAVVTATVYFTRATARRVAGAFLGGAVVGLVGVGIEWLAHTRGWWKYPFVATPYGPPLMYPVVIFLFATLALVGWRVTRRFGWRGQVAFLGVVTFLGTVRDYRIAAWWPEFIVFAPGIGVVLVDAACWAILLALAQATTRFVAGPVGCDPLARLPHEPTGKGPRG
jgi:hypothetical protein